MPKYILSLVVLALPILVEASVVGTCNAGIPEVDASRCNDPSYYSSYRAAADAAINAEHDARSNEVHADNQANNDTVVDASTVNLANFLQCQRDVCSQYLATCSGADIEDVGSRRVSKNIGSCIDESENRFAVAKQLSKTAAMGSVNRKARTTVFEKMLAIGHRTKTITLAIADDLRREMETLSSKGSFLVRETRDVAGSDLQ